MSTAYHAPHPRRGRRTTHRLGQYLLGRRLFSRPGLGRVYLGRHRVTGMPALVLSPDPRSEDAQPLCRLELGVTASSGEDGERPHLALEVRRHGAPDVAADEVVDEVLSSLSDMRAALTVALNQPDVREALLARPPRGWQLRRAQFFLIRIARRFRRRLAAAALSAVLLLAYHLLPALTP
jgi:hypothetical protein